MSGDSRHRHAELCCAGSPGSTRCRRPPPAKAPTRPGHCARPGGTPPEITGLLEQVQIDHTPVDVIVVD
ncbi:hypothetical protein [Amycolatopsis alba]|uniref:Uncharacterized protein n=1 Tax=Amycolatopsis alba DSM 44262 TaxID=1125972 RepID=A0A229R8Y4_AMYAL|nr:hypothetical protein [Amycolatopsis alba]OXM43132.1 hypothetical protein CFP75_39725 [Amycolatopsis alba DSM 44262]